MPELEGITSQNVPFTVAQHAADSSATVLQVKDLNGNITWSVDNNGSTNTGLSPRLLVPQPADPTWVTTFQAGHGFTQSGTGTNNLNDTTDFVYGSQSAWIRSDGSGTNANTLRRTGMPATNFTGKDIVVLMKMDDWTPESQVQLYLGDTTFANFGTVNIGENLFSVVNQPNAYQRNGEWNKLIIPWSSVTLVSAGTGVNRASVTDMQFRIVDNGTGNLKLHVNGIGAVPTMASKFPNGVVSVCFDDNYASATGIAKQKMDQYGFPGTSFVISDTVGVGAGNATLQSLKDAERYSGWSISGHSYTKADHDANLMSLSDNALDYNLSRMKKWLLSNGFRGADHFAYPGGYFDTRVESAVKRYFSTARTLDATRFETVPPAAPTKLYSGGYMNSGTSTATAQGWIDSAFANQAWLIFTFHNIVSSVSLSTDYSQANFNTIIDYLNTKGIPVRTIQDVLLA